MLRCAWCVALCAVRAVTISPGCVHQLWLSSAGAALGELDMECCAWRNMHLVTMVLTPICTQSFMPIPGGSSCSCFGYKTALRLVHA